MRAGELARQIDVEHLRLAILHADAGVGDLGIGEAVPQHIGQPPPASAISGANFAGGLSPPPLKRLPVT